ncbi:hypothetical protein HGRIS_009814 [Hohenbuehelia grisea]|uniref:BTB domain-containing protein n=1 Tax=Hohenbuehelia grisea TaxID=104357 RepID=A0ABR3J2A5_9AGAR
MEGCDWDSLVFDYGDYGVSDPSHPSLFSQVPTPPQSLDGDDSSKSSDQVVSVSTTFFPGAQTHPLPPDLTLLSADAVFFYVHSHVLLGASDNSFLGLVRTPPITPRPLATNPDGTPADTQPILKVPEQSTVLNVILHAVYDMSCAHYSPTLDILSTAIDRFPAYGLQPAARIKPQNPLYSLLLSYAPLQPLELYALAAAHDLNELAVTTSSHLLGYPLATLTDEMATRIGPIYLKRLFFLHFGRVEALKRILLPPPHPHPPTPWCDFTEQKKLTRAWALASAYLAWDARPDLPASSMEAALRPLGDHLTCDLCRHALDERVKNLIVQWTIIRHTI